MTPKLQKETLQFLTDLKENNDREWFNRNKDKYITANENFIQLVEALINEISLFDKSVRGLEAKNTIFRIYRDTRFSKDKSPYKTNFGAAFLLGKEKGPGIAGYYFHLQPGNSFLAGGVHNPEPGEIKAVRRQISSNAEEFLQIINNKDFTNKLEIKGEKLAKVPQGFDKSDPMAEFLKYKELMVCHDIGDDIAISDDFVNYSSAVFEAMLPFNTFLNTVLM